MAKEKYILLLNDTLKNYLLTIHSRDKRRLREKFEFLENGLWDTGVRVKRLKGISKKVIFEARLSKGERILFTLGKHDVKTAIYVWGVVKHDDITAASQNILPHNVPFLHFEPEAYEEFPEISIDDLPGSYFSQEDIEEKSPDDYGPQKWLILTDEEWKRLLLNADPDNFEIFLFLTSEQRNVLKTDPPVLLSGTAGSGKTTISVYYLLREEFKNKKRIFITYHPYLKRFSERIYKGLVKNTDYEKSSINPDFFVFRDLLKDIITINQREIKWAKEVGLKEFENIFRHHKLYNKYDTELVWEEIRSIIKGAKPPISVQRYRMLFTNLKSSGCTRKNLHELRGYLLGLRNFEFIKKIESFIERKTCYSNYNDFILALDSENAPLNGEYVYILQEILKIIEKKANNFSSPLLTFQEYISLGKKRAPHFLYDREDIYSIAEFYQSRLDEQGLWDEIDLCKKAVRLLSSSHDQFSYDLVVCDEVQDFSDIQLYLIFLLTRNSRNILLAGDLKQVINPSGFRWEEVKNKFYERGIHVPEVFNLNLNFRCVGNIVKLSNAMLDLKQKLIGLASGEVREEWKFNGKPVFLIYGINEDEMIRKIKIAKAGQIILVRNDIERRKLKKALDTELVFTINEAKGLEFNTVLLWKFSQDSKSAGIWRKIKEGRHFEQRHYPHIKHEINLLYVAVTRARNTLIMYDGAASAKIWDIDTFKDILYRTKEKETLSDIWQHISSPSEWEEQGDYFFEREYYPAAVECYKNSGNPDKKEIAEAFLFSAEKKHGKAAELLEKHGYLKEAAENYELHSDYGKALILWEKLQQDDRIRACRIRLYEKQGNYGRAAEEWVKLKNYENAIKNWEKEKNFIKIAEYYLSKKQYENAALQFEQAGNLKAAARCYKKMKKYDKAADLYYNAEDYKNAALLYKKLKNTERLIQCHINLKDFYSAALLYEKNKDIENAIAFFKKCADISQENRNSLKQEAAHYQSGRVVLKSAIRYSALSMYEKSAPLFFKQGNYSLAVNEYEILHNYQKAAECFRKQGKYYESALELEKTDSENKWNEATGAFLSYIYSNRGYNRKRADLLYKEAERCFQQGSYDRALARYKAIEYPRRIYDVYLVLDRDEEALEYFLTNDMCDFAYRYLDNKEDIIVSPHAINRMMKASLPTHYRDHEKYYDLVDVFSQLLITRLRKNEDEEALSLIDNLISSLKRYYFYFDNEVPDSLFNLVLESKNYNSIFQIIRLYMYKVNNLPERIISFLRRIKKSADEWNDANLLACYYFIYDRQKYENNLLNLTLTEKNFELFANSDNHFHEAVEYLLKKQNTERAAMICRIHGDNNTAASIYESNGDFKSAGKYYREAKNYDDALRCFQKINDEKSIARVYEKMQKYQKAVEIWKKFDNTREITRIQKKIKKEEQKRKQLDLF